MELGDGNFPAPYPPPPAEPIRFFFACEPDEENLKHLVRNDWFKWVPNTEFIEDWARWKECKGMVFYSGAGASSTSHNIAHSMRSFFGRDKGEALVYQLDSIIHRFILRDLEWLEPPGRCYH